MSARAKMLASLRRDGTHDELRQKSQVEKKRRARQAAEQRAKNAKNAAEGSAAVEQLDAATATVSAARVRGSAPLMGLIKRVVDRLQALRREVGVEELERDLGVPVASDPKLLEALRGNPNVAAVEGGDQLLLQYQARHSQVKDRASLLELVQGRPNGLNRAEVSDCYDGVWADLEALRIQGKLLQVTRPKALSGTGRPEELIFPWDERFDLRLDAEVAAAWHAVPVPEHPEDLDKELRALGIPPTFRRTTRRQLTPVKKTKKKRRRRFDYRTNQHMAALGDDAPAS